MWISLEKMRPGRPLHDADRLPWRRAVVGWVDGRLAAHEPGITTCSTLKRAYQHITIGSGQGVRLVFLRRRACDPRADLAAPAPLLPPTLLRR